MKKQKFHDTDDVKFINVEDVGVMGVEVQGWVSQSLMQTMVNCLALGPERSVQLLVDLVSAMAILLKYEPGEMLRITQETMVAAQEEAAEQHGHSWDDLAAEALRILEQTRAAARRAAEANGLLSDDPNSSLGWAPEGEQTPD